jgi:hypothetical protein
MRVWVLLIPGSIKILYLENNIMEITSRLPAELLAETVIALVSGEEQCEKAVIMYADIANARDVAYATQPKFGSWREMLLFSARKIYGDNVVLQALEEFKNVIEARIN